MLHVSIPNFYSWIRYVNSIPLLFNWAFSFIYIFDYEYNICTALSIRWIRHVCRLLLLFNSRRNNTTKKKSKFDRSVSTRGAISHKSISIEDHWTCALLPCRSAIASEECLSSCIILSLVHPNLIILLHRNRKLLPLGCCSFIKSFLGSTKIEYTARTMRKLGERVDCDLLNEYFAWIRTSISCPCREKWFASDSVDNGRFLHFEKKRAQRKSRRARAHKECAKLLRSRQMHKPKCEMNMNW